MDQSAPIIICDQNEDFRLLLREMLSRHGFFHVLETSSSQSLLEAISNEKRSPFVLVQGGLIDASILPILSTSENFIIIAQSDDDAIVPLVARFGVKRFLGLPFSSQRLLEKLLQISQ
jgi:DNA-binding NtrC family response regulator